MVQLNKNVSVRPTYMRWCRAGHRTNRRQEIFTLGDARSFSGLTSNIPTLGSMSNFDADVRKLTAHHQCENRLSVWRPDALNPNFPLYSVGTQRRPCCPTVLVWLIAYRGRSGPDHAPHPTGAQDTEPEPDRNILWVKISKLPTGVWSNTQVKRIIWWFHFSPGPLCPGTQNIF